MRPFQNAKAKLRIFEKSFVSSAMGNYEKQIYRKITVNKRSSRIANRETMSAMAIEPNCRITGEPTLGYPADIRLVNWPLLLGNRTQTSRKGGVEIEIPSPTSRLNLED